MQAGSFGACLEYVQSQLRNQMQGEGRNSASEVVKRRLKKFYTGECKIDVATEHYTKRFEPKYSELSEVCGEVLVLFGIDFMSKAERKKVLERYQGKEKYIDRSNCFLLFPDAERGIAFVKENAKKGSNTYFKVEEGEYEEDLANLNISMNEGQTGFRPGALPVEWIELNPYVYVHKHGEAFKQYHRPLFVRYANKREKENVSGGVMAKFDRIIDKCRRLWEVDMDANQSMKNFYQQKMRELLRYREQVQRQQGSQGEESRSERRERSRQKKRTSQQEAPQEQDDESVIIPGEGDDDLASNATKQLAEALDRVQLNMDQGQPAQVLNDSIRSVRNCSNSYQGPNYTSTSRGCPLPYRVMRPAQEGRRVDPGRFNYKAYLLQSTQQMQRTKQVSYIDVDLDSE